jgi:hypothetical protein
MTDNKFLYSKPKPVKDFRPILSSAPNIIWALDLADYSKESGTNKGFILVVVDIYTRYMYARVLANKNKESISKGLKSIFEEAGTKPVKIYSDRESALIFNEDFQGIEIYHVDNLYSSGGSPIAERAIRTIKEKIEMLRDDTVGRGWKQHVNNVVLTYNNSTHRTIKMTPTNAKDTTNKDKIDKAQENIANRAAEKEQKELPKSAEVIDIKEKKNIFEKGYKKKWNEEVLKIVNVEDHNGVKIYELSNGKKYYHNQLKKVTEKDKEYLTKKAKPKKSKAVPLETEHKMTLRSGKVLN